MRIAVVGGGSTYTPELVDGIARRRDVLPVDELALVLDLPQAWKSAYEAAYNRLQASGLNILLATYFDSLGDNLNLAVRLPVAGLHIDVTRAPEQLSMVLDQLERAVLAPYWVNYHCEHHMFMHMPCWNLPKAHRLLKTQGAADGMLIEPGGYVKVLALASGKELAAAA